MRIRIERKLGSKFGLWNLVVFFLIGLVGCEGESPPAKESLSKKRQVQQARQAAAMRNGAPPNASSRAARPDSKSNRPISPGAIRLGPGVTFTPATPRGPAQAAQPGSQPTGYPHIKATSSTPTRPSESIQLINPQNAKYSKILLSANDDLLAAMEAKGGVHFYDPQSAKPKSLWKVDKPIVDIAFSFDAKSLYALTANAELHAMDLETGKAAFLTLTHSPQEKITTTCLGVQPNGVLIGTKTVGMRMLSLPRARLQDLPGLKDKSAATSASSRHGFVSAMRMDGNPNKLALCRQHQHIGLQLDEVPKSIITSDAGRAYLAFANKEIGLVSLQCPQSIVQKREADVAQQKFTITVQADFMDMLDDIDAFVAVERNGSAAVVDAPNLINEEVRLPVTADVADVEVTRYGEHWFVLQSDGALQRFSFQRVFDHAKGNVVTSKLIRDMYLGRYSELEATLAGLRKQPQGTLSRPSQLEGFYSGVSNMRNIQHGREQFRQALNGWEQSGPVQDRPGFNLAKANLRVKLAWNARGNGTADTVTRQGFAQFEENLTAAAKLLDEVEPHLPDDVELMRLRVTIAMGLKTRRVGVVEKYSKRILEVCPTYMPFHNAVQTYLMPRWHGQPGELEAYARGVADHVGGQDGDRLYARSYASVRPFYNSIDAINQLGFDYERVQRGLKAAADSCPSLAMSLASARAVLNYARQDRANALDAFQDLERHKVLHLWPKQQQADWPPRAYENWVKWVHDTPPAHVQQPTIAWLPHKARGWFAHNFAPDNTLVTYGTGGRGCQLRRWDPRTGKLLEILGDTPLTHNMEVGPNGDWVIINVGRIGGQRKIVGVNFSTSQQISVPGDFDPTHCKVTPDGRYVIRTDNLKGIASAIPLQSNLKQLDLTLGQRSNSIWLSGDGKIAFFALDDRLIAMDLIDGRKLGEFPKAGSAWMEPGAETALVAVKSDAVYSWNPRSGEKKILAKKQQASPKYLLTGNVIIWASKKRDRLLLSNSRLNKLGNTESPGVSLYDLTTGKQLDHIAFDGIPSFAKVSSDGKWIAFENQGRKLKLYAVKQP